MLKLKMEVLSSHTKGGKKSDRRGGLEVVLGGTVPGAYADALCDLQSDRACLSRFRHHSLTVQNEHAAQ